MTTPRYATAPFNQPSTSEGILCTLDLLCLEDAQRHLENRHLNHHRWTPTRRLELDEQALAWMILNAFESCPKLEALVLSQGVPAAGQKSAPLKVHPYPCPGQEEDFTSLIQVRLALRGWVEQPDWMSNQWLLQHPRFSRRHLEEQVRSLGGPAWNAKRRQWKLESHLEHLPVASATKPRL